MYGMCSYTGEYTEDFMDLTGYGSRLGDFAMEMLDSEMIVCNEQNGCEFKD